MDKQMNLHSGHRQRVREKFDSVGLSGFADHEILEFLLFYAVPYRDTNPLAHKLINHFGSLDDVLAASKDDLVGVDGITENAATLICLVKSMFSELSKRSNKKCETLGGFSASIAYAKRLFVGEQVEKVYAILLDRKNQVKATKAIATGHSTAAVVDTKILAKFILQKDVDRIILAHNHPISDSTPSAEDLVFTKNIVQTLKPLGIEVLDHIIVGGDDSATSFAHEGYLSGTPISVLAAKQKNSKKYQ